LDREGAQRAPGSAWFHDEFRQESVAQLLCYVLSQTLNWTKGDVDAAQLGDRLDIGVDPSQPFDVAGPDGHSPLDVER
jgi:hypothetical protein